MLSYADNIQLLRRCAEDAKRDSEQWAASPWDAEGAAEVAPAEGVEGQRATYRPDALGSVARLVNVFRNTMGRARATAGSTLISETARVPMVSCRLWKSAMMSRAALGL